MMCRCSCLRHCPWPRVCVRAVTLLVSVCHDNSSNQVVQSCNHHLQRVFLEKLHNHGARVKSGRSAFVVFIVRVGKRGGPVVVDMVAVVDKRDEASIGPGPVPVHFGRAIDGHGGRGRRREVVAPRPVGDPGPDVGEAPALAQAARDGDGRVVAAVEVEQGNVVPARVARHAQLLGVAARRQGRGRARGVKGTRHGREGGDALRSRVVARQLPDHAAPLGLARGVDPGRVDAEVGLDLVQHLFDVGHVVGRGIGRPLPVDVATGVAILQGLGIDDDVVLVKVWIRQPVQIGLPVRSPTRAVKGQDQWVWF